MNVHSNINTFFQVKMHFRVDATVCTMPLYVYQQTVKRNNLIFIE